MAVLDFGSDVDSESGGPSLSTGLHSDMTDFDDIDSTLQMTECVSFGDPGLPCLSGKIPSESGSPMVVSYFASDVDSEAGGPSLPSGVHSDMPDYAESDCVSQVSDCMNFGKPRSGTTSPESGCVTAMSDFASDVDSETNEPSLLSGVHLDMPDFDDSDSVSQVSDCRTFGEQESGTFSVGSGNMMAMSDFASDIDSEPGEPSLPSGVYLDMSHFADCDSVSQVSECVNSGKQESSTFPPGSGNMITMSDFTSVVDSEPGGPSLPSGVHLDMTNCADSDSLSQVSDSVNFGEPRSGTTSLESGCMMAMSDFASVIDLEPGEPSLPLGVHLDMPYFVDSDSVSQVSDCVTFGEQESGTFSPGSGNMMAMSDFASVVDLEPGEPSLPSGVQLDMPDFVDSNSVSQVSVCVTFGEQESGTFPWDLGI